MCLCINMCMRIRVYELRDEKLKIVTSNAGFLFKYSPTTIHLFFFSLSILFGCIHIQLQQKSLEIIIKKSRHTVLLTPS